MFEGDDFMETLWWLVGKFFWLMAILMGLTSFYCLIRLKLLTFVKLAFFASLALGIGGCADEQAQLAAMTPEQRAEYELKQEQKKQEEKAAKEAKKAQEEADKKNAEEVEQAKEAEAQSIAEGKKAEAERLAEIEAQNKKIEAQRKQQERDNTISIGDSRAKVERLLGSPNDVSSLEWASGKRIRYYYHKNSGEMDIYIFDNDKLVLIQHQ